MQILFKTTKIYKNDGVLSIQHLFSVHFGRAWNIFMYLLSFNKILLHDKIDRNRKYDANATEYIYQLL